MFFHDFTVTDYILKQNLFNHAFTKVGSLDYINLVEIEKYDRKFEKELDRILRF